MLLTIQNVYPSVIKNARFNLLLLIYTLINHTTICTLYELSNKVCVSNKTEDLNIHIFNISTGKNEWNILTKDISCECRCKGE